MFLHLFLKSTLQFLRSLQQFINRIEVVDEFGGSFFSHTRTAGEIVGRVAHQCQEVDDLKWGSDTIFITHLLGTHHLITASMTRTVDAHPVCDQLAIILIGREHKCLHTIDGISLFCQCSDNIIGLKTIYLQHGNTIGSQQFLDDGNGFLDILRRGFTLCFVCRKLVATEGWTMRVKSYT